MGEGADACPLKVLITRPAADAEVTARRVTAMGFEPVIAPMLEVRPTAARVPARVDAVLLTSRNALPTLPVTLHSTPLLAVGGASAAAACAQGFANVSDADGDAVALHALVNGRVKRGAALLLPCGRGQGRELAAALRRDGYVVYRRVVYEAVPAPDLPAPACAALRGGLHAALFFSAATARAFVAAVRRRGLDTGARGADACAIGEPARVALEALPWRRVRVAARPTQDALLALLR